MKRKQISIMFAKLKLIGYNLIMETNEIDLIIENQMSLNLDDIMEEGKEEESTSLENLYNPENFEWLKTDVLFVVIDTYNRLSNLRFAGKSSLEWIFMAGGGLEEVVIKDTPNQSIIDTLREIKTDKQYTVVFYSDTPLIDKNLLYKIIDYFTRHRLNAMPLLRGFVFKTDYLYNLDKIEVPCFEKFDEKAFTILSNATAGYICDVLQNRVLNYHIKNGVNLLDKKSIKIDAEVEIESGVSIYGNNTIKGESYIGKNVILEEGNKIYSSIICENAKLCCCKVNKSKISNGKILNMVLLDNTTL